MNQDGIFKRQVYAAPFQCTHKIRPHHKGKAEEENLLAPMLLNKRTQRLHRKPHIIVQRVDSLPSEQRESEDARATRGEHCTILQNRWCIKNNHRHTHISRNTRHDTHERFLLTRCRLPIQEDLRHALSRRSRRGHRLYDLRARHTAQVEFLEETHGQKGNLLLVHNRFGICAERIENAPIAAAVRSMMLRQAHEFAREECSFFLPRNTIGRIL